VKLFDWQLPIRRAFLVFRHSRIGGKKSFLGEIVAPLNDNVSHRREKEKFIEEA